MRQQFIAALQLSPNLSTEPPIGAEVVRTVKGALARLSAREATVLRLQFGLTGRSHDLAAVARLMGLTLPTVRRLRRLAFLKLRWLTADVGAAPLDESGRGEAVGALLPERRRSQRA